jgi:sortase A
METLRPRRQARRRDRRPLIRGLRLAIGLVLVVSGVALVGNSLYGLFVEDNVLAGEQQDAAAKYKDVEDAKGYTKPYKDADSSLRTGDVFAKVYIPRLGDDWVRLIGQGIKWEPVLNKIGVGHYPQTQFPGEVGNFAVAAHRGGFGGSFKNIHRISVGDHVYVQTNAGWFDYEYRQTKIVLPEEVGVIKPIPEGLVGAVAGGKYMTLTSCEPIFVNTHRIIVWLELVGNSPAPNR